MLSNLGHIAMQIVSNNVVCVHLLFFRVHPGAILLVVVDLIERPEFICVLSLATTILQVVDEQETFEHCFESKYMNVDSVILIDFNWSGEIHTNLMQNL